VGLVAFLVISLLACGVPSPEVRLREVIDAGQRAAENGDLGELGELVSDRYADDAGRDRDELLRFVRAYLFQLGPVHTIKREKSLVLTSPGHAEVRLVVAVASFPVESVVDVDAASADLLRLDLEFVEEDGDWRLIRGDWSSAEPADLL
jgi:hypothetical protein